MDIFSLLGWWQSKEWWLFWVCWSTKEWCPSNYHVPQSAMSNVSWIKNSTHNVESGMFANKNPKVNKFVEELLIVSIVESTLWYFPQCWLYNLNFTHCGKLQCKFSTTWKELSEIFRKPGNKMIYLPQCAKYVEWDISHTMWTAESMLTKLPQYGNRYWI